jgi:hypothetical protein
MIPTKVARFGHSHRFFVGNEDQATKGCVQAARGHQIFPSLAKCAGIGRVLDKDRASR